MSGWKEEIKMRWRRLWITPTPEERRRGFAAYASGRVNAPLKKNPNGDGYIIECERVNQDKEDDNDDNNEREVVHD